MIFAHPDEHGALGPTTLTVTFFHMMELFHEWLCGDLPLIPDLAACCQRPNLFIALHDKYH